tara:strand:+ start:173 stop:352 length:180 start_codon:yes stop_codon:yes gene_type:complete
LKSKFIITLHNSKTKKFLSKEEEFLTFEEACVFANRIRNQSGFEWATISVVRIMEETKK